LSKKVPTKDFIKLSTNHIDIDTASLSIFGYPSSASKGEIRNEKEVFIVSQMGLTKNDKVVEVRNQRR
jgi:hypothetical protein